MTNHAIARITAVGAYLPPRTLTNSDLEKIVNTSDDWIFSRTGMRERRIAEKEECTSDMGAKAALKALFASNLPANAIEMIIVATMSPDYISPSTAALIQAKIGAERAAAMDIQVACGFVYGLSLAKAYIESGIYNQVLVIAAEKMSAFIDYQDRSSCVLFGDGAGAAIVGSKGSGLAINTTCLGADGQLADLFVIPAGGAKQPASKETVDQKLHYVKMAGSDIFKHAVRRMTAAAKECLEKSGLKEEQIKWLIPHQANIRIISAVAKQFNLPIDRVYKKTLPKYGNTSASTVAIALSELLEQEQLQEEDHLLLVAFGGGLTWGASILTKITEPV